MALYFKLLKVIFAAVACLCSTGVSAQTLIDNAKTESGAGSITGRVLSDGQGVADAVVFITTSIPSAPRTTRTDSSGNFVFAGLDRGLYSFSATAPGLVMPPTEPDASASYYRLGDSVQLTLTKAGVITGTVSSSSGDPVVLVLVTATLIRDVNNRPSHSVFQQRFHFTDDRGVYRIYGLLPGTYIVSAAGGSGFGGLTAYDGDSATYAPSSTRDTAGQIQVSSGSETTGVDIKYRGDSGHVISGYVTGRSDKDLSSTINISLSQIVDGNRAPSNWSYVPPAGKAFTLFGISDGEYELNASLRSTSSSSTSEIKRVTVNGADMTGIELNLKPLASVAGRVLLTKSDLTSCRDKREPLLGETLIALRSDDAERLPQQGWLGNLLSAAAPNKTGEFQLKNLRGGQYDFEARFFAKYWYLKSIMRPNLASSNVAAKSPVENSQNDLAKNGIALKFGDNISGVTISLAEGAASLRGTVKPALGIRLSEKLFAYLVPAERDAVGDVLRFFVSKVGPEGSFAFSNLPPGRYWAVTQVASSEEVPNEMKLRRLNEAARRTRLRRDAEAGKLLVELKPCQNLTDYALPITVLRLAE